MIEIQVTFIFVLFSFFYLQINVLKRGEIVNNTIVTDQGSEVYENSILMFADEYEKSLHDPGELYKPNNNLFTGLIKYINKRVNFDRSILQDINILNDIWEIYTDLVYRYNQKPTIEEYALLIGIHRDTIYSWANGERRNKDICKKLNLSRADTIKMWQGECALNRYKGAAAGNVGYIFLCKAVDKMVETAPEQVNQYGVPQQTAQQIAENHKAALELPEMEKPDL